MTTPVLDTAILETRYLRRRLQAKEAPPTKNPAKNPSEPSTEFENPAQKTTKNGQKINDYQFPKTAQHILETGVGVIIAFAVVGSLLVGAAVCS
jgi:hypothetical protein